MRSKISRLRSIGLAAHLLQPLSRRFDQAEIDAYSPVRFEDPKTTPAFVVKAFTAPAGIVAKDRHYLSTCDLVLMNLKGAKHVSKGSMIEVGWADAWRKPLVTVIDEGNVHLPNPMLEKMIEEFRVSDLDEGIEIAIRLLLP